MNRFTTWTVARGEPMPSIHPNRPHHRRLLDVQSRLGRKHALAWCSGCTWFLRWPVRDIDRLHRAAHDHLTSAHFDALLAGRACIDPELSDHGDAYLRARLQCVHPPVGARCHS